MWPHSFLIVTSIPSADKRLIWQPSLPCLSCLYLFCRKKSYFLFLKTWSIQQTSTAHLSGAAVITSASITLSSKTPCKLWLDACVLHQQTICPCRHQPADLCRKGSKGVCKGGWGYAPPLELDILQKLLPAQRILIVFTSFGNLSTKWKYHGMNLHANFKVGL